MFETQIRNRGPAHALDMKWSASVDSVPAFMGHAPPDRLYVLDEQQLMVEVPLGPENAPVRDVVRIKAELTDDEGHKAVQWCLRFTGDPHGNPEDWTLEDLDCISLRPRRGGWPQPLHYP